MWICLNHAYLSIVEPCAMDTKKKPNTLLVRARREGDIERVFGAHAGVVERRPERDYLFRAYIDREVVGATIMKNVVGIDYGNFKNSVADRRLHDAYAGVWHTMSRLQPTPPYSGKSYTMPLAARAPAKRSKPATAGKVAKGTLL